MTININLNSIVYRHKDTTIIRDHYRPVPQVTWLERDGSVHNLSYDDDGVCYEGNRAGFSALHDFSDYVQIVNRISRHHPNINADFLLSMVPIGTPPSSMFHAIKNEHIIYPFKYGNDAIDDDWYKPQLYLKWDEHIEDFCLTFQNIDDATDYWDDILHLSPSEMVWAAQFMQVLRQLHLHKAMPEQATITPDMMAWFQGHELSPADTLLIQSLGLETWFQTASQSNKVHQEIDLFP